MTAESDQRSAAWAGWRDRLTAVGESARRGTERSAILDLSTAHPGGIARLFSGRVTRLSTLIRDEKARARSMRVARQIEHKAAELAEDRGIDAVHLLAGEMLWHGSRGRSGHLPLIVQPAAIQAVPGDFELLITGRSLINPEVVSLLERRFSSEIDVDGIVAAVHDENGFHPDEALHRLDREFHFVDGVDFQSRLVMGTYSTAASGLSTRAATRIHPILDAVAGVPGAADSLQERARLVTVNSADERSALSDALILDASAEQERVVAQASTGTSFVVRTVPGSGVAQAVSNILATLVPVGRRVAVVASSRATLDAVAAKLASRGLAGMAVTAQHLRQDVVHAISRNERAQAPQDREERAGAYARIRDALLGYRRSLGQVSQTYGVSVEQALSELARLSLLPDPPHTKVRLHSTVLEALAVDRTSAAALLRKAADLGQFDFGPDDSSWYGAEFDTPQDAENIYLLAKRLAGNDLQVLVEKSRRVFQDAGLRRPTNLTEIGEGLALLLRVRSTLDRFQPVVYDRSLEELIIATAPRREQDMPVGSRRRLRQLAKEYQRPGAHVNDVHQALQEIQEERILWGQLVADHRPPNVPVGLGDVNIMYTALTADLQELQRPLDRERIGDLMRVPIERVQEVLDSLSRDVGALEHLHERAELLAALEREGLSELVDDFARRHVTAEHAADELELAWWQSVLELLLERDGSLLNANTQVLARLERDFVLEDRRVVDDHAQELAATLASRWREAIDVHPDEAAELRQRLLDDAVTPSTLMQRLPVVGRAIAPVWLFSPYQFGSDVPDRAHFDTVILLDAASMALSEAVLPIAQSEQVIAIGDPVLGTPSRFSIDPNDPEVVPITDEPSAFAALRGLLPEFTLDFSYRSGGRALASLVNRRWYDLQIRALPSAAEFAGQRAYDVVQVDAPGRGTPDPDSGNVEALPAEVAKVVDLAFATAVWHPDDSLMVVTPSEAMAQQVRAALRSELATRQALQTFFDPRQPEPFLVLTVAQAAARSRDRVIFALGYGRTPHGRMLSAFGAITPDPSGMRWLGVALTRARRHLTLVAALQPRGNELERLTGAPRVLFDLLGGDRDPAPERRFFSAQALLVDLGRRLHRKGLKVNDHFDDDLGLAVDDGTTQMIIETDSDYNRDTLREVLRLHPTLLTKLGWKFRRVYSFELFANPQRIADEIAAELDQHRAAAERQQREYARRGQQ
ncbi:AAA family ATPase [Pseudoclavibacter sp. CFCC 14310]|uniref:DEAD/DEAH box helicase n=1 Tax=Pseudoclavibacter sp. CFCC 14310 TaxID=2615180 RepID=UPI0013010BAE|nr:ATP-binding protein [Pseudoclavibacter sp. CFCC 14310]KAB1647293.1 AAA family ATPase [Pseudoclavibacter sp. CFCC 14310]